MGEIEWKPAAPTVAEPAEFADVGECMLVVFTQDSVPTWEVHRRSKTDNNEIDLIVNTPLGRASFYDERAIRRAAMQYNVVTFTTLTGANAAASAIAAMRQEGKLSVLSLQEHHS